MSREGDNYNGEYYVPIKTRWCRRIVKANSFGQASAIEPGILTFQCNYFLQTLRLGSIETIKDELANISNLKRKHGPYVSDKSKL